MKDEIRDYLYSVLGTEKKITDDHLLVTSGALNSLKVIELAMWLEKKYGISFAAQSFNAYAFDSINSIDKMVRHKLGRISK